MKFKVGDIVRIKREALNESNFTNIPRMELLIWTEIEDISGWWFVRLLKNCYLYESCIELVPPKPEFKYWEEIEVRDEIGAERKRVIFLCKTTANDTHQYITADISKKSFDNGARFRNNSWRFARKARPKLTRKEVAEKFWVSEDFVLVD